MRINGAVAKQMCKRVFIMVVSCNQILHDKEPQQASFLELELEHRSQSYVREMSSLQEQKIVQREGRKYKKYLHVMNSLIVYSYPRNS